MAIPSIFVFGRQFQTTNVTPFLSSSSSSSSLQHKHHQPVFSNGIRTHFGFILSPETTEKESFYESLQHFLTHVTLSFQVINRKNVIVSAKRQNSFSIRRVNSDIIVTATETLNVSHLYLNTSLLLLLQLSFTPPVPSPPSPTLTHSNADEAEIRNAIDNPTYTDKIKSRKGSVSFTLIEPIRVDVSVAEITSASTVIRLIIKNTHPTNTIAISSIDLRVQTTERDVDHDNDAMNRNYDDGAEDDDNVVAASSVNGDDRRRTFSKSSRDRRLSIRQRPGPGDSTLSYPHIDRASWSIALEGVTNGDYSKMIRIDRCFDVHVFDVQTPLPPPPSLPLGQGVEEEEHWLAEGAGLGQMVTCINPQDTWTLSYQLTTKDPNRAITGRFLTPLDIRYVDVNNDDNHNHHNHSNNFSNSSSSTSTSIPLNPPSPMLTFTRHIAWSSGTTITTTGDKRHSPNAPITIPSTEQQHQSPGSVDVRNDDSKDREEDVGVVMEGPSVTYTLSMFSVTIQLTNRSQRVKNLSLGIVEDDSVDGNVTNSHNHNSADESHTIADKKFIPIDCLTKLPDLPPGDSLETIVRILPLAPGDLLLNGFYLLEENSRGDNLPPPDSISPHGVLNTSRPLSSGQPIIRRFAHALTVRVIDNAIVATHSVTTS